ncbi:hypothetical protein [Methanothermobacter sp.]|nr:hypothetical protein [Methanothermobacter sp.]MDI9617980.1 hypothetical protein [Methanothermobacter sp.]
MLYFRDGKSGRRNAKIGGRMVNITVAFLLTISMGIPGLLFMGIE